MHVGDLPTLLKDALGQNQGPPITLRVLMFANFHNISAFVNGVPTFIAGYSKFQFDLSNRLIGSPTFSQSRPQFPDGDPFQRSELEVPLVNTDTYISCLQTGAMIKMGDIDQATIQIDAFVADITTPLTMFKGRILGPPKEERGRTTFTCIDTVWDVLKRPVLYEDFGAITGSQEFSVVGSLPYPTHRVINTANGHFCAYNALVAWDAQGLPRLRFSNSNATQIDIKRVTVANQAKPGSYQIRFTDAINFTLTYPDNTQYRGAVNVDTITPKITILRTSWTSENGAGITITFNVGVALKGNPVTIARNFIEKALLSNWGNAPAQSLAVKLDAAAWDAAERRFQSYTIYLSETNENNSVWERKSGGGNMPLNCLELAQRALDHVGCFVRMRQDGFISITTPFLDGYNPYSITADMHTDIVVNSVTKWNYLTVQYGEDGGSYSATTVHDLRNLPTDEVNEKVVSMPYWKAGTSRFRALWLLETYVRRYFWYQQMISIRTIPQIGLPMGCGDIVRVVSTHQPSISFICEITSASVTVDSECSFELVIVQQWEGDPFKLCVAHLELEKLW